MNKHLLSFMCVGFALLAFTGCNGEKQEEETFRTVEYFNENKEIRKNRLDECEQMKTMNEAIEKDCDNAKISLSNEEHKKSRSKHIDYSKLPT